MILQDYNLTTKDWGVVKLARPAFGSIATDPWGTLASLKGTPWGDAIPVVSGEVMSHALHGRATPLMRVIQSPPHALLRKIPEAFRLCVKWAKRVVSFSTRRFATPA